MKKGLLLLLLLAAGAIRGPVFASGVATHYQITARLDLTGHLLSGDEEVTVTNTSRAALREVHFVLYPNQFIKKNPGLTEMNYLWHYPSGFDKGWLRVEGILQDAVSGAVLKGVALDGLGLPEGTLLRVPLAEPLSPGSTVSLRLAFETRIPRKYGPFGHYRDVYTLQGGWYPYLAPVSGNGEPLPHGFPEESSFRLKLALGDRRDAVLNGVFFDDVSEIEFETRRARQLSLVAAPQFHVSTVPTGSKTVSFYSPFQSRYKLEKVLDAFSQATAAAASFFPSNTPDHVVVVESYLRAVMTFPAESMVLLSDRFMVTVEKFDFRNLNRLEAARAVAQLFAERTVGDRESPNDFTWVTEALAWSFRNRFLSDRFENLSNLRDTAGSMSMFRPFNRMAASPTIPFSETYVGDVVNRDALRESVGYFNNTVPSGQLLSDKLRQTIGEELYTTVITEYLGQPGDFQTFVEEVAGRDMDWFFAQWKRGYPPDLDYSLTDVERNRPDGAGYLTRFTVERTGGGTLIDPLEIRLHRQGAGPMDLVWDGVGKRKNFEVHTDAPVKEILLDPRARTVQTNDGNDLSPRSWEMVMDRGDVDVGSGGLGAGTRVRLHKKRDRGRWMFVTPFFSPAELGVEAGMLFDFGGNVEGLVWNRKQELSVSYSFTNLRGGFADPQSGRIDGVGQNAGLKLRYSFQNKVFEEDPMNFESVDVTAALYRKELGGDFNFFRLGVTGAKVFALHPKHKLAGVVSVTYSDGFDSNDVIPAQALTDLSSFSFIGFAGSGRFLEENAVAGSLEWRHDLMSGLDMGMPMNNRIRRIQGVLAFDAGWVTPRFDQFRFDQAIYGVRYGLRFHYDFLGVRPSDFTIDIGRRLGDGNRDGGSGMIYSVGILQSF